MISKVMPSHSFYHTCRYICTKQEAEVLLTEGVRSHRYQLMAEDFMRQQGMRPSKKLACFHGILSFYPGEKLPDERMIEIAQKYLQGLGLVDTQYAICKHSDRPHAHLHIVANLVDNEGKAIKDSYLGVRGKKTAQGLTTEYGLIPAREKHLELTHLECLNEPEATKYKIYQAISEVLPQCCSMEELEKRLLALGIETQYKCRGQSSERQGISFRLGHFCFKGSSVDRKFSFLNLQKTLALNQGMKVDEGTMGAASGPKASVIPVQALRPHPAGRGEKPLERGAKEFLRDLLQPETFPESIPHELLKKKRSKKKNRSQGL